MIAWVPKHPAAWLDLFPGVLRCSSGRAQQGGDSWSHLQNPGQQQQAVCSSVVTPCHARAIGTRPGSAWRTADWRWLWHIMAVCCLSAWGGCGAQAVWGEALERVAEGLAAGRRWLWDEAARRVGILLAAPAAFEGEHFLQARTSPAARTHPPVLKMHISHDECFICIRHTVHKVLLAGGEWLVVITIHCTAR